MVLVVEVGIVQLSEGSQLQFSLFISSQVYQQRSTSSPHLGRMREGAEERKGREGEGRGGNGRGERRGREGEEQHGRTKEGIEKRPK